MRESDVMRTTLDIDKKLLATVVEMTGEKSKSKAVEEALRAYLRSWAAKKLIEAAGAIDLTGNVEEFRRADSLREEKLERMRREASERDSGPAKSRAS